MKNIEVKVKSGQKRESGKKIGGRHVALSVPGEEVRKLVEGVLERSPSKLGQMLFAYGLTASAQEAVGYVIPGSVEWEEGKAPPRKEWTEGDTVEFFEALDAFEALEREKVGGPNLVELRGFFRAMKLAGMTEEKATEMAIAAKVKHAENAELSAKVWEKVEALG